MSGFETVPEQHEAKRLLAAALHEGPAHAYLFHGPAGVMHVSPGLGTTFVPFRFAARPEATELTLRCT